MRKVISYLASSAEEANGVDTISPLVEKAFNALIKSTEMAVLLKLAYQLFWGGEDDKDEAGIVLKGQLDARLSKAEKKTLFGAQKEAFYLCLKNACLSRVFLDMGKDIQDVVNFVRALNEPHKLLYRNIYTVLDEYPIVPSDFFGKNLSAEFVEEFRDYALKRFADNPGSLGQIFDLQDSIVLASQEGLPAICRAALISVGKIGYVSNSANFVEKNGFGQVNDFWLAWRVHDMDGLVAKFRGGEKVGMDCVSFLLFCKMLAGQLTEEQIFEGMGSVMKYLSNVQMIEKRTGVKAATPCIKALLNTFFGKAAPLKAEPKVGDIIIFAKKEGSSVAFNHVGLVLDPKKGVIVQVFDAPFGRDARASNCATVTSISIIMTYSQDACNSLWSIPCS
jgi:hypothetical protein